MSIGKQVQEAIGHMDEKDFEAALFDICAPIDATAKKEYGQEGKGSYKSFIHDNLALITKVGIGTRILNLNLAYDHPRVRKTAEGLTPIEELIYHAVRCGLYHESTLAANLKFELGMRLACHDGRIILPAELIYGLITAVVVSPVNANETMPSPSIMNLCGFPIPISRLWGRRNELDWLLESVDEVWELHRKQTECEKASGAQDLHPPVESARVPDGRRQPMPPPMPDKIRHQFELLKDELIEIRMRWKLFRQLYGTSEKCCELLLATASTFFAELQRILLDDVMLGLCRLTDKTETCGKQNLVFRGLVNDLAPGYPALAEKLAAQLEVVEQKCKPFRTHRHERLAHLDAKSATNEGLELLPGISRMMVEEALTEAEKFMNVIQVEFDGGMTHYTPMLLGDADALIGALKKAWAYDELAKEGKIPWNRCMEGKYGDV